MTTTARIAMVLLILSHSVRGLRPPGFSFRIPSPPGSQSSRSRGGGGAVRSGATADPADGYDPSGGGGGEREFTVTWKASDGKEDATYTAYEGETLRTSALRRGVVSPHNGRSRLINCRGLGTCGTCAVEISAGGEVRPEARNRIEDLRLSLPPHGGLGLGEGGSGRRPPSLRLACQVQVFGDVTVVKRTGFWGQRDAIADVSEAVTYLGDLEYVLDRKSPPAPVVPNGTSSRRK